TAAHAPAAPTRRGPRPRHHFDRPQGECGRALPHRPLPVAGAGRRRAALPRITRRSSRACRKPACAPTAALFSCRKARANARRCGSNTKTAPAWSPPTDAPARRGLRPARREGGVGRHCPTAHLLVHILLSAKAACRRFTAGDAPRPLPRHLAGDAIAERSVP
ncbi:MAG: hypothetical protein QOJ04_2634, partial [Caballeronia sp.]|nr:hypothetical protein [Caballeronia sp.]